MNETLQNMFRNVTDQVSQLVGGYLPNLLGALAILVIEASERSGSLITFRCGLEQGREVMAVPGSILTGRNRGAHALLRDGAKVVETVDDNLGRDQADDRIPCSVWNLTEFDVR